MSDSDTVETNLDDFETALYGNGPVETVEEVKEEIETPETTPSATEDESNPEAEESEDGDDTPEEPEEEEAEKPKPRKRKSAQERIDELTREKYELQRLIDLERQERNRAATTEPVKSEDNNNKTETNNDAPDPSAVDAQGEPVYPLGEFDPKFIRDLTAHTIRQENEAARLEDAKERQQAEFLAAQKELTDNWTLKVQAAAERIPDLSDKFETLQATFRDIPQEYGNFLASSIMTLENGPDILDYLADNLDEAAEIVSSGAFGATIALGRLDQKLSRPKEVEKGVAVKATQAPPPPPSNKGSSAAKSLDPTNLDDFEKLLYQD